MSTDRIHIRNLRLRTRIGVRDWEKEKRQDVVITVALEHDARAAGRSDDLADAIDYKVVKDRIVALVEDAQYALLEALAQRIADACLEFDGVEAVTVEVDKPGALRFADSVGVTIRRP